MKFAILLPVYNGFKTIEQCVDSVMSQTAFNGDYPHDFRLFIVNNMSTDGTHEKIYRIRDKYSWQSIVHLTCPVKGISAALNTGLFKILSDSSFSHVARIDADDTWHTDKILEQISQIHDRKLDVCGTNMISQSRSFIYPEEHDDILAYMAAGHNPIAHPSVVISKEVFLKVGVYNQVMNGAEDFDLWCRAASCGLKFGNVQKMLVNYNFVQKDTREGDAKASLRGRIFANECV